MSGPWDHVDWSAREDYVWDKRPAGLREKNAVYPPVGCVVVNGTGARIPFVFYVNFRTGLVGKFRTGTPRNGKETVVCDVDPETGALTKQEEWVVVPGVRVVPVPPDHKAEAVVVTPGGALVSGVKRPPPG